MSSPSIEPTSSLADLAVRFAGASRVFHRYGLDYCCHGAGLAVRLGGKALAHLGVGTAGGGSKASPLGCLPVDRLPRRVQSHRHRRGTGTGGGLGLASVGSSTCVGPPSVACERISPLAEPAGLILLEALEDE
ncbi:MAG: DUF542 domain-containing protein [Polyangiaceae bacterium]|nr:DUF542 domain-containing protein [Polyangiaceae bacterium]